MLNNIDPAALDWIDENADLLDTSMSEFVQLAKNSCYFDDICEVILSPEGANFDIKEIVGTIIRDEKHGTWEGLDNFNKAFAASISTTGSVWSDNNIEYTFAGCMRSVLLQKMVTEFCGVDLLQLVDSMTDFAFRQYEYVSFGKPLIANDVMRNSSHGITLSTYANSDLYIAVDVRDIDLPKTWKPSSISQPMDMFHNNNIRTVTGKNTLYFNHTNSSGWIQNVPFIFVSTQHLAKACTDKIKVSTILPREIIEKYNLPIVNY